MITYPISISKKIFSAMFSALQYSFLYNMNHVCSFIDDFLFTSFQQKNKIRKGKHPNGIQYLLFRASKYMICLM